MSLSTISCAFHTASQTSPGSGCRAAPSLPTTPLTRAGASGPRRPPRPLPCCTGLRKHRPQSQPRGGRTESPRSRRALYQSRTSAYTGRRSTIHFKPPVPDEAPHRRVRPLEAALLDQPVVYAPGRVALLARGPASASRTDSTQAPLPSRAGLPRGAGTGAAGDMSSMSAYLATVLRLVNINTAHIRGETVAFATRDRKAGDAPIPRAARTV